MNAHGVIVISGHDKCGFVELRDVIKKNRLKSERKILTERVKMSRDNFRHNLQAKEKLSFSAQPITK